MNFFRTVSLICSGPSAFPTLMKQSVWRALFHLLIFTFLTALLLSFFILSDMKKTNAEVFETLEKEFSCVTVTSSGVLPAKNTLNKKTFILPYPGVRLDYLPAFSAEMVRSFDSAEEKIGILWMPLGFSVWQKLPGEHGEYLFCDLPLPRIVSLKTASGRSFPSPFLQKDLSKLSCRQLSSGEMASLLEKNYVIGKGQKLPVARNEEIPMQEIEKKVFLILVSAVFFSMTFFPYFAIAFMTTLFFALVQHFFAPREQKKMLSFSNVYVVMVYAAFPAVFAGAVLSELLNISYSTAFFILFFIIHLFAFGAIRKKFYPPEPHSPDED